MPCRRVGSRAEPAVGGEAPVVFQLEVQAHVVGWRALRGGELEGSDPGAVEPIRAPANQTGHAPR